MISGIGALYVTANFLVSDSEHLSTVVSEAFVRFFVELVGHYPLFVSGEREDGYSSSSSSPVPCSFQREGFRKAIPSKTTRRFLEVFMETQMFGWFIQERELHRRTLRGKEVTRQTGGQGFHPVVLRSCFSPQDCLK